MFNIIEQFNISGGDTTNLKSDTKINKSFEQDQKINRSMAVDSITKLMQNVSNDVIQKNSANASAAVSASNTMNIEGIRCDDVIVTGVRQKSQAIAQVQVKSSQANTSKISTEISNNIKKTIEKQGGTDLAKLQADNTKQLNDFMNAMPGYDPNAAAKLAEQCPKPPPADDGGFFSSLIPNISIGNTCNASSSYELNASVKQALNLDESFKIDDKDDLSSDVKNSINQANFASCAASASANNTINIKDIMCSTMNATAKAKEKAAVDAGLVPPPAKRGKLEISDIEQTAIAQLFMTCIFDQKNTSKIATKMATSIEKKYSQMYDAVEAKLKGKTPEEEKKMKDFLKAYVGAGYEKLHAASGILPEKPPTKDDTTSKVTGAKSSSDSTNLGTGPDTLQPMIPIKPVDFNSRNEDTKAAAAALRKADAAAAANAANASVPQPLVPASPGPTSPKSMSPDDMKVLYIAGGSALVIIIILVVVFFRSRK